MGIIRRVYTTHETAKFCNAHNTTIINWIEEGKIKAYITPGGHRRIKREDLLKFMEQYKIPIPVELKADKKRILIVDDDPEAVSECVEALRGNNYEIDYAYDGFGAGRKIYKMKPDLILLDFRMPGMDGFQVCEALYKDEDTKDIPVIAVTALNSEEDKKRIKECGVKEYVPKPIDIENLIKLVKKYLE